MEHCEPNCKKFKEGCSGFRSTSRKTIGGNRRKGRDVNEIVKINGRDCPGKSGSWFIPNMRFNEEGERG